MAVLETGRRNRYSMEQDHGTSKGHGMAALLLSIIGLAIIILVGVLFGMFGLVPGMIMEIAAVILGILSLRSTGGRSGKGGLIVGTISILAGVLVGLTVMSIGTFLKTEKVQQRIPTLASYSDESWRGMLGLILKMQSDGVDFDLLSKEIDDYNNSEMTEASGGSKKTQKTQ